MRGSGGGEDWWDVVVLVGTGWSLSGNFGSGCDAVAAGCFRLQRIRCVLNGKRWFLGGFCGVFWGKLVPVAGSVECKSSSLGEIHY